MNALPSLIATCWTSAGNVAPLDESEVSPFDPIERIEAIGAAGWKGFGLGQDDLRHIEQTIGFERIYQRAQELGLNHIEVELGSGWWLPKTEPWHETWQLLLRAARGLKADFIKVGTTFGDMVDDVTPFVAPMRAIAEEAAAAGTRIALEPLPFALIATVPQGAELVAAVDHPAAGLCVDFWHIFRANTTLQELAAKVPIEKIFSVELSDAYNEIHGTLFEDTRDNRTLLGEGDQDVVGFINTLVAMGFQGLWGVEILSKAQRSKPLNEALQSAFNTSVKCFELAEANRAK
ncbi:MAG: hypothetical protein RL670_102 [Actinomycetota bacterium]|jgi:sugar phosphate isomerase/epimerase